MKEKLHSRLSPAEEKKREGSREKKGKGVE